MLLRDSRVRHWFTDGRAFVRKVGQRYDIIEADALRPTSAYAGNPFSVEYLELLHSRLNPGGLAVTWTPTPRVLASFVKVFPHVLLFDFFALGSTTPVIFDRSAIDVRIRQPFTHDYYVRAGVDVGALLASYVNRATHVWTGVRSNQPREPEPRSIPKRRIRSAIGLLGPAVLAGAIGPSLML